MKKKVTVIIVILEFLAIGLIYKFYPSILLRVVLGIALFSLFTFGLYSPANFITKIRKDNNENKH